MYVNEVPEGQLRDDLILVIKTFLEQRLEGIKDKNGNRITIAFPKLIYVLQENNIEPDSKYYWLSELAAKCTAKRLVPDYVSEKVMKQLKGDVYPPMGCVAGKEVVVYAFEGKPYVESFQKMWERLRPHFAVKIQPGRKRDSFMDLKNVKIHDLKHGWVECYRIIKNFNSEMLRLTFSDGRTLDCTPDHPLETENRGTVRADSLSSADLIPVVNDYETTFLVESKKIPNAESFDVTTESEHFTVNGIYSHNCRSFLTPDRFTDTGLGNVANAKNYSADKHKYYGRFNQGVVTINLVDVACSSGKNMDRFWSIMNERLELCHKALRSRHEHLLGTPSDVSPILFQDGAIARLKPGETIDPLLYNGYSTISLGYAGLAECVRYMLDVSHTSPEGKEFGLKVMQALDDACDKWKKAENIDYSVYGSPMLIQWGLAV